jgi:putative transposase
MLDDFNRAGQGTKVDFSIHRKNDLLDRFLPRIVPSERFERSFDRIIDLRGKLLTISVDNGPEYLGETQLAKVEKLEITFQHIQPGQPLQYAYLGSGLIAKT